MQLQDAINIVRDKFMAEAQGEDNEAVSKAYFEAFENCPAMMETATQIWAAQLIAQNIQQQQAAAQQGGEAPATQA
ncbi:hypothetical protein [Poriferisphaera sp. WC338]|uniref:hypothetical protein n=1 Tax=Poriferisphaera sp. WC338 TaxID=3425129 RepID=UPI003D8141B1